MSLAAAEPVIPRAHYSRSLVGNFPRRLLDHVYNVDEKFQFSFSPKYSIGVPGNCLDLTYWNLPPASVLRDLCPNPECLFIGPTSFVSEAVDYLLSSAKSLRELTLVGPNSLFTKTDLEFLYKMTNICKLDLSDHFSLNDEHIKLLALNASSLVDLNVSKCSELTDQSPIALATHLPGLKRLIISHNKNVTNLGLNTFIFACEQLQSLDASHCPKLRSLGIIVQAGQLTQYVNRRWTSAFLAHSPLDSESLVWITTALPDLQEVDFSYIQAVTNDIVEAVALNCVNLRILRVSNCPRVTQSSMKVVGSCCTNLVELDICCVGSVNSEPLTEILTRNVSLERLDVSGNHGISDSLFADLMKITRLRHVNVRSTGIGAFGVACLAERCPMLKYLNISKLKHVNDAAINVVSECCSYLEQLFANDCFELSDVGLTRIAARCRFLTALSLCSSRTKKDAWGGRHEQYSDALVETLLGCCKRLQKLLLVNQHGIRLGSDWLLGRYGASLSM
jgi:F-box/leucine-rich repeat protein 2/20